MPHKSQTKFQINDFEITLVFSYAMTIFHAIKKQQIPCKIPSGVMYHSFKTLFSIMIQFETKHGKRKYFAIFKHRPNCRLCFVCHNENEQVRGIYVQSNSLHSSNLLLVTPPLVISIVRVSFSNTG